MQSKTIKLANPRGFCAGVDRAIDIVNIALDKFGPPVYVRHEVVHNRKVVQDLKIRGARFVDNLDEVPEGSVTIFSAHGVPKSVIKPRLNVVASSGSKFVLPVLSTALKAPV